MLSVVWGSSLQKIGGNLFSEIDLPFKKFEDPLAGEGFARTRAESEKSDGDVITTAPPSFQRNLEARLLVLDKSGEGLEKNVAETLARNSGAILPFVSAVAFRSSKPSWAVPFDGTYLATSVAGRITPQDNAAGPEPQSTTFSLQPDYGKGIRYSLYTHSEASPFYGSSAEYSPLTSEAIAAYIHTPHYLRWVTSGMGWYSAIDKHGPDKIDYLTEVIPDIGSRSFTIIARHFRISRTAPYQPSHAETLQAQNYQSDALVPSFIGLNTAAQQDVLASVAEQPLTGKAYLSTADVNPDTLFAAPALSSEMPQFYSLKNGTAREAVQLMETQRVSSENPVYKLAVPQISVNQENYSLSRTPDVKFYAQEKTPELKHEAYHPSEPFTYSTKPVPSVEEKAPSASYLQARTLEIKPSVFSLDTKADNFKLSNQQRYLGLDQMVQEGLPRNYQPARDEERREISNTQSETEQQTSPQYADRARDETRREASVEEKAKERYDAKREEAAEKRYETEKAETEVAPSPESNPLEERLKEREQRNNGRDPKKNYDTEPKESYAGKIAGGIAVGIGALFGAAISSVYDAVSSRKEELSDKVAAPLAVPSTPSIDTVVAPIAPQTENTSYVKPEVGLKGVYRNGTRLEGILSVLESYKVTAEDLKNGSKVMDVFKTVFARAGVEMRLETQEYDDTVTKQHTKNEIITDVAGYRGMADTLFGPEYKSPDYKEKGSMFLYFVNGKEPEFEPSKQKSVSQMELKAGDELSLAAVAQGIYKGDFSAEKSMHEAKPRDKDAQSYASKKEDKCPGKIFYNLFHGTNAKTREQLEQNSNHHQTYFTIREFSPTASEGTGTSNVNLFDTTEGKESVTRKSVAANSYAAAIDNYLKSQGLTPFWKMKDGSLELDAVTEYNVGAKDLLGEGTAMNVLFNGQKLGKGMMEKAYAPVSAADRLMLAYASKEFAGLGPDPLRYKPQDMKLN